MFLEFTEGILATPSPTCFFDEDKGPGCFFPLCADVVAAVTGAVCLVGRVAVKRENTSLLWPPLLLATGLAL